MQNPTISLADDVAVTRRVVAAQGGPVILVGHSYGGAVITEAGNDPKVAGLVYIAAFAPDAGESVSLADQGSAARRAGAADPAAPGRLPAPRQGEVRRVVRGRPRRPSAAAFMADSQVPWGVEALNGADRQPAWKTKPSWYLVATDDRMIPPAAQRQMSKRVGAPVVEVKASHAVYASQPQAVASLIRQAARGVKLAASSTR